MQQAERNLIPTILIVGPTAGGKTDLAFELARQLDPPGECICADSMQVYRGMDIGTAKPTNAQRAAVPHHLLDVVPPDCDEFSVDVWLKLAREAETNIRGRGRHAVIVGGTNLYVQAFVEGLFDGPPPSEEVRASLNELDDDALRTRLEQADPVAAARIHRRDRRRTIRALEVYETTGEPMSGFQRQWQPAFGSAARGDLLIIGMDWPVEAINRRINARVRGMMEAGLLEEVRRLWSEGHLGRQAREGLGYKQLIDHLEGRASLDEAVEQIKIKTRRFAKQQRTWLRRFRAFPLSQWLEAGGRSVQDLANQAVTTVTRYSATRTIPDR